VRDARTVLALDADLDLPVLAAGFIVSWLLIGSLLSVIGGWYALARRFRSDDDIDAERFRFRSGGIGWGVFPVNYGNCLFATVGRRGRALSILLPFRFMHPPLVIPWSAVERCEPMRMWLSRYVAVYVTGFRPRRLIFAGALGRDSCAVDSHPAASVRR
jgi:hypothetical protein